MEAVLNKMKDLSITFIEDQVNYGYTAISKDYPEVVSEGQTEGQALVNFGHMLDTMFYGIDEVKHVDNFDMITGLLDFSLPNTMYFIQILQRRKDNPEMNKDVRVINNYYIYSPEDMVKLKNKIVEDCSKYNARAYINLNRLDTEKIGLYTQKIIVDFLINKQFAQIKNAYASACGNHHSETNKKWIVDIDTKDDDFIQSVIDYVNHLYTEAKTTNRILARIPTKNGVHLICEGFRMDHFAKQFPGMTVNKNAPTILYIN